MHRTEPEPRPEASTFECVDCWTRVPSTWVDYDILGYGVCPECGATQRPLTASRHVTSGRGP